MTKLFERSPLKSVVVRAASLFDPKIFLDHDYDKLEKIFKKMLHYLMGLNILSAAVCNKIVLQFSLFHKEAKLSSGNFRQFSKADDLSMSSISPHFQS